MKKNPSSLSKHNFNMFAHFDIENGKSQIGDIIYHGGINYFFSTLHILCGLFSLLIFLRTVLVDYCLTIKDLYVYLIVYIS